MGVRIKVYRSSIGRFHNNCKKMFKRFAYPGQKCANGKKRVIKSKMMFHGIIVFNLVIHVLIVLSNDVHPNPGPQSDLCDFTICHANIHSPKAENKFFLVKPEAEQGKHDIIELSETWLSHLDKSEDYKIQSYQLIIHKDRALRWVSNRAVMVWFSNRNWVYKVQ